MKRELFLNGLPDLLILRLLDQREMYGYELVAKIAVVSKNTFRFGEGCIYPILHRMVADDLLRERAAVVEGRTRRYYRLSSAGRRQLASRNRRWQEVSRAVAATAILGGTP